MLREVFDVVQVRAGLFSGVREDTLPEIVVVAGLREVEDEIGGQELGVG